MERDGICQDCGLLAHRYTIAGKWLCRSCYNKRVTDMRSGRKQYGRPAYGKGLGPHYLCQPCRSDNGCVEESDD